MKAKTTITMAGALLMVIVILAAPTLFPEAGAIQGDQTPPNASPCAGQKGASPCIYDLMHNGTNHTISYYAGGPIANANPDAIVLDVIRLDEAKKSIVIYLSVAEPEPPARQVNSWMTIYLPRSLIDATNSTSNQAPFVAFDNGKPMEYHIGPTFFSPGHLEERDDVDPTNVRALSIGLEPGRHRIEIIGSTIAPEFITTFVTIVTVAALALTLTVGLTRISRFPPQ